MKPYYEDDLVTLYHGDFRDDLAAWNAADVLIWDPPYGIDYNSGSRRETLAASIEGDEDTSLRDYALGLWRTWIPKAPERPSLTFGSPRVAKPEGVKMTLVRDKGGAPGMGGLR